MSWRGTIGDVVETGKGNGTFSIEWRIPGFLSLAGKGGHRYGSPVFDACGGSWRLKIYPRGSLVIGLSDSVDLCLLRFDSGLPKTLNVTFAIRGAEGIEKIRERNQEFSEDDPACYWCTFCSRRELARQKSRLLPGNMLIISLDLKIVVPSIAREASPQIDEDCKKAEVPTEKNQSLGKQEASTQTDEDCKEAEVDTEKNQSSGKQGVEELVQSLHRLLESKKECDVTIKVQDKEFPAHRLFLQARSTVFEAMFSHDMVEKQSGMVKMEDCDPETFPDFLEHVYTGSFEMISSSNVFSLYAYSDKYDLGALKQECSEFIKSNMAVASFCEAITLAIKHNDRALIECATEFFCNNSIHIVKTAEWQRFLIENAIVGNELFIKLLSKD